MPETKDDATEQSNEKKGVDNLLDYPPIDQVLPADQKPADEEKYVTIDKGESKPLFEEELTDLQKADKELLGKKGEGEEEKKDDKKEEGKGEEKKDEGNDDKKEEGEKKEGDDDKKEEPVASDELDFKVPESKEEESEEEPETSWAGVAKEGFGVDNLKPEATFDDFKTAVYAKAKEDAKKEFVETDLSKFSPRAQNIIKFLSADENAAVEDLLEPLKVYDEVLALDNEGIVKKDLELKKWDEDMIDAHVAKLKEEGKLDTEAYSLRKLTESMKANAEQDLIEDKLEDKRVRDLAVQNAVAKETTDVVEAINKVEKFMGLKITKEHKDFVAKQYPIYREKFNKDPNIVAKAMMFDLLGEAAEKHISKSAFERGRDGIQEKLHNSSKIDVGTGRKEQRDEKVHDNPWDAWKEGLEEAGIKQPEKV